MADLTVGVTLDLENSDRIVRQLSREMEQAGGDAGERYGGAFAQALLNENTKVARSFEKSVTQYSRLNEVTALHQRNLARVKEANDRVAESQEKVNALLRDGKDGTDELTAATEELRQAERDRDADQRRAIITNQQIIRSNKDYLSTLRSIKQAQEEAQADQGINTTLLSLGKFISALRAVAVPAVGTVVGGIASVALEAAAALTQGLWMIPAAAGAAAAGIGTVSLATMGFADAVENIGDQEKFAEAIQALSPNAQQAALAIQALLDPLRELKNATQDAFFADGAQMINEFANQYLPMIEQLTTGVATGLNQAMSAVFDQLMTPETQAVLGEAVNDIVEAFKNLAPAAGDFAGALAQIVATGSSFLPEMAEALARGADSFATLIEEAAKSGDLEKWFRDGIDAVAELWNGIQDLAKEFSDLAGEGTESMRELMDMISLVSDALGPLTWAFSKVVEPIALIGQNVREVEEAILAMTRGVQEPLKAIGVLAQWVAEKFERIGKFLGPFGALLRGAGGLLNRFGSGLGFDNATVIPRSQMDATKGLFPTGSGPRDSQIPPGMYRRRDGTLGTTRPGANVGGAGLPGVPAGGYPVPAPPPEKSAGGGSKKSDEPPFTADPSQWSVDAIPVTPVEALPDGLASQSGLVPNAQNLNNIISGMFPMMPSAGGWRPPDGFNEHSIGEAVDFMVGENLALGDAINDFILSNAKALGVQYTIWRQATWRPDGTVTPMGDRGDDTQNHFDHVHARVFPGDAVAGGVATGMGSGGFMSVDPEKVLKAEMALNSAKDDVEEKRLALLELQAKGNATQRQLMVAENNVRQAEDKYRLAEIALAKARQGKFEELETAATGAANKAISSLGQVGAALADDFGLSEGLPGIAKWFTTMLANMAAAPMIGALSGVSAMSPIQGGHGLFGMMGARNIAAGGSPLGLSMAPMMGGMAAPMGMVAPGAAAMGPTPLGGGVGPALPAQHGMGGGAAPGPGTAQTSMTPGGNIGGGGFQGVGGLPLQAAMTATAGLDMLAPGAGQAAQMGIQLINRTAGYVGQLAGIGVGGLMETFLPNNSEVGDPSKSWVGRIAAGVAGARPALPNTAGAQPPQAPRPDSGGGQQQGGPMVNIENLNNNSNDSGQQVANTMARMAMTGYGAGGPR